MVGTGGWGLGVGAWGLVNGDLRRYSSCPIPNSNRQLPIPPTSDVGQPFSNLHLMQFRGTFSVTASYCKASLGMRQNTVQLRLFARRYTRGSDGREAKEIHRDC